MKTHVSIGSRLIRDIDVDPMLREIVGFHHERWDGKGYLEGLAGPAIPLSARIVAIADVFDALLSDRPYKKAFPWDAAVEIMRTGRGQHFDPELIDAFLGCADELRGIADGDLSSDFLGDLLKEGTMPSLIRKAAP